MADLKILIADPSRVRDLSREEVEYAAAEVMTRQLELASLQLTLHERLLAAVAQGSGRRTTAAEDRLLTAEEVADRLRTTLRYVYRNAGKWPFTRRLGRKKILFSEAGLHRFLEQRKP